MRLLVVGANGLLGSNVVYAGQQRGWDVCGTYHSTRPAFDVPLSQFSLEAHDEFTEVLDAYDPAVVVNCAAMTDVDACEQYPEQAHVLNGETPGQLAAHCERMDVEFVHVSTDYVFDGAAQTPYVESATPNPIQEYGESKLAGERAVGEESASALLPRLSFVWGLHRSTGKLTGFPAWVRDQLQAGDTVPLFTDQWITPTRAGQAAETVLDLIEREATGRYHIACTSCVTPYEFGEILVERAEASTELLTEGAMADVDRDAARPTNSCLNVTNVESTLGRSQPTLQEDIDAVWDAVR
jgi:dTDP-4-dehydrorhamnose reductase